ncbi:MAG: RDD family protein, partial [Thiotrichaceae bacterium]|nr:RDD family protein [Thiotrichaceae bacterium]
IINDYGLNPSWSVSFLRLIFALLSFGCLGLGYWWRLFTPYTWHDHLSNTRVINISKIPKDS